MSIAATYFDPVRGDYYRRQGWWQDLTFDHHLANAVAEHGDSLAVIDPGSRSLTWSEFEAAVGRIAGGLAALGVEAGDVVGFQLPNWWETLAIHAAIGRLGAVSCPLHTIYRQSELKVALETAGAKLLLVPEEFRGFSYSAQAAQVTAGLTDPPRIVTVRGEGDSFRDLAEGPYLAPDFDSRDADEISMLLFTSGTTGAPKGALHSHNTIGRAAIDLVDLFSMQAEDRLFVPSPVTHVTGMLYATHVPVAIGAVSVLMERWEPEQALRIVLEHECVFTGGATPFVRGLIDAARKLGISSDEIPLKRGTCGGADVPPAMIAEAEEILGTRFTRVYGMTEGVTVTASEVDDPLTRRAETDGKPLPGFEFEILDRSGEKAPPGELGEAVLRGPANFLGYLDPAHNEKTIDSEGWIRTGDLLSWDENGYVTVGGRLKDLIIRGGENIAVKEVEDLLIEHPGIEEVAIVGMRDEVLGERACAFCVPANGTEIKLESLVEFLRLKQIAPQKYPERVEVMRGGLPKTSSGKVRKVELRAEIERIMSEGAVS